MAIPLTTQFAEQKSELGSEPVWLVELLSAGVFFATREPGFTGKWKAGDGLVAGSGIMADDDYPTYDGGLAQLVDGGIDSTAYALDGQGLGRTASGGVSILNQELFSDIIDDFELSNGVIRIRLGFYSGTFQDYVTIFFGAIDEFVASLETMDLDLIDDTVRNLIPTPPQTGSDFFPQAVEVGRAIPIVIGDPELVPAFPLIAPASSTLLVAFSNSDTEFYIRDVGARFPAAGTVLITNPDATTETVEYTQVSTAVVFQQPALRFSGLTRTAAINNVASATVELQDFKYTYLVGFGLSNVRKIRLPDGVPPTDLVTYRNIPLDPNGGDHRQVTILEVDSEQVGLTVTASGPNRSANLIVNGEGNADPNTVGWTPVAGSWDNFQPSATEEYVLRGVVNSAQAVQSEMYQDITTTPGGLYRLTFTTLLPSGGTKPPYQNVTIGTTASPASIFDFGEIDFTFEQGFDLTFRATDSTTRLTLLVDFTGVTTGFEAYFDHIHIYDLSSENPANAIPHLITTHMPQIVPDEEDFSVAEAIFADDGSRMSGSIDQTQEGQGLLGRLAQQYRSRTFLGEDGKQKFRVFSNSNPAIATFNTSHTDKGTVSVRQAPEDTVYTRFYVYFDRRPDVDSGSLGGREAYQGVMFATPEETNAIGDDALAALCLDAQEKFRIDRVLEVFADMIPDANTASLLLSHLVRRHTHRPFLVDFTTYLNAVEVELADVVKFVHPVLPPSLDNVTFEVVEKQVHPNGCLTSWTIAEIRQAQYNVFVENWEPPFAPFSSLIHAEEWEPGDDPESLFLEEGATSIDEVDQTYPWVEEWEPSAILFNETLSYWTSTEPTTDYGLSPVELSKSLSAAFNLDVIDTVAQKLLPNNNISQSEPHSRQALNRFQGQALGEGFINLGGSSDDIDAGFGPGGTIAARFFNNRLSTSKFLTEGSRMCHFTSDTTIVIWVRLTAKGPESRPILVNKNYDSLAEDVVLPNGTLVPGTDEDDIRYMLWWDAPTDRFKASINDLSAGTYNDVQGNDFFAARSNVVTASTFGAPSLNTWYMVTLQLDYSTDDWSISVNAGAFDTLSSSTGADTLCINGIGSSGDFNRGGTFIGGMTGKLFSTGFELGFHGDVAHPSWWQRKLTSAELTELYNGGNSLPYPYV